MPVSNSASSPMDEHQGLDKEESRSSAQMPELSKKDKALLKKIQKMFDKAKKHKDQYDKEWLSYYKFFRGKQWADQRPSYRHSDVVNLVWSYIQGVIPIMTDSRPKIEFIPTEPSDKDFVEILNELFDSDWENNRWLNVLTEVLYDGAIYGTGISTLDYDDDLNFGLGGICYRSVDPFYIFPHPDAVDINEDLHGGKPEYLITAIPMDVSRVKKDYPEKAKYVKADILDIMTGTKTDLKEVKFRNPVDNKVTIEGSSSEDLAKKDQTLIITAYMCDYETEELEEKRKDENGEEQTEFVTKLKYPKGRKVVCNNKLILEDEPLDNADGRYPFSKFQNYILPREFYGVADVEQLEGPQRAFNKLVSFAMDVLTLMGNPIWVVDTTSGVDTDNLFNRPGMVVEKEPGSEVRRESGVQLQPYVLQLLDRMEGYFNQVSGSQDITRGVNPPGVTAARAIESLQEAAQTRIRQKMRNLDNYLRDMGRQYAQLVLQHYNVPRVHRITNMDGSDRFFKFSVEESMVEGQPVKVARVRDYEPNLNGELVPGLEKEFLVRGEFDVRVSTGSGLPFAKAEREQRLLNLYDRQIIDAEEVLKGIELPNAEAILERMQQKAEQAAQAQAQGLPPEGAPPPA